MAHLPEHPEPFNPKMPCPMCGFRGDPSVPPVTYCWEENCEDGPGEEHLHQECAACTFIWAVLPITDEQLAELERQVEEEERTLKESEELERKQKEAQVKQAVKNAAAPASKPAKKAAS